MAPRSHAGLAEDYIDYQNEEAGHFQEGEVRNLPIVLAMKTARRIVPDVLRPCHFLRPNNFEWNLHLLIAKAVGPQISSLSERQKKVAGP
jgi:hypothetical protein